jgi:phosphoglycerate dehydrogenase-like enzyme
MKRTRPAETKLVICAWHQFTEWRAPAELAAPLRRRWPRMKVVHVPDYSGLDGELSDTDIFVGWSLRPEQFRLTQRLKWLHCTAAGVNQLLYPELRDSRVVVTNASGVHAPTMAEHTLGMLIALARHFPETVRYQARRHWAQQDLWDAVLKPHELQGRVLLIIGLGAIGRELARRVRPLGMRVWGVTRSGRGDRKLAERILPVKRLDETLPEADYVVLAAPETPETLQLIGARQLAAMKPTAFIVNVARGSLVDEGALIAALSERRIGGAALDVMQQEPLPPESLLWKLENVFLTPHISGVSDQMWPRQAKLLVQNLERWFAGRGLINRVDLKRGY